MANDLPQSRSQRVSTPLTPAAIFLIATINDGGEARVRALLKKAHGMERSVAFRLPSASLDLVASVGPAAWDRLFTGPRPAQLRTFPALRGAVHTAPATPGDLLFHLRAMSLDACFELAHRMLNELGDAITVGAEDPAFAGGSYVHTQRYVHNMPGWESVPVPEQERVIGRSKADDIEMTADVKPANAHVALTSLEDADGNSLEILRANMPYGRLSGEMGTFFIGYCATPEITEKMLANMFLGNPAGNHDRLLDFSTAMTGCEFFAPTTAFLESL